ncbi:MAG: tyrosine-type recombinase/integrase [Pseudomonadales bacterium]|nr:tyrosine-type recombinase/integrase [Pseudomonadales bacterium]
MIYGTGLHSAELHTLRVRDMDFGSNNIFVYRSKGNKDRSTMLPQRIVPALKR